MTLSRLYRPACNNLPRSVRAKWAHSLLHTSGIRASLELWECSVRIFGAFSFWIVFHRLHVPMESINFVGIIVEYNTILLLDDSILWQVVCSICHILVSFASNSLVAFCRRIVLAVMNKLHQNWTNHLLLCLRMIHCTFLLRIRWLGRNCWIVHVRVFHWKCASWTYPN